MGTQRYVVWENQVLGCVFSVQGPTLSRRLTLRASEGKSLEIIPLGVTRLTIGNDVFEW